MNKLLGSISLITLTCLSSLALARGVDMCSDSTCYFPSLIASNKHVAFHCDAIGNVSEVRFANHNVLVKGFRNDEPGIGTLTLEGSSVNKLKKYYFVVRNDPEHSSLAKTVVVELPNNGSVVCHIGKGGRKSAFS